MTDPPRRYPVVRATAVLSFGGMALLAAGCVVTLVVADRWRGDHPVATAAFWVVAGVAAIVAIGLVRAAVHVLRQPTVLTIDDTGYRVSRRAGAVGVRRADWTDVGKVRTDRRNDHEVVVLQLRTGSATQIPVHLVGAPRSEWLDDIDARLNRAHGQRRLT